MVTTSVALSTQFRTRPQRARAKAALGRTGGEGRHAGAAEPTAVWPAQGRKAIITGGDSTGIGRAIAVLLRAPKARTSSICSAVFI
jgi:hypothetical protein